MYGTVAVNRLIEWAYFDLIAMRCFRKWKIKKKHFYSPKLLLSSSLSLTSRRRERYCRWSIHTRCVCILLPYVIRKQVLHVKYAVNAEMTLVRCVIITNVCAHNHCNEKKTECRKQQTQPVAVYTRVVQVFLRNLSYNCWKIDWLGFFGHIPVYCYRHWSKYHENAYPMHDFSKPSITPLSGESVNSEFFLRHL